MDRPPITAWPAIVWGLALEKISRRLGAAHTGGIKLGLGLRLHLDKEAYERWHRFARRATAFRGWHTYMGWRFWRDGPHRTRTWAEAEEHDRQWRAAKQVVYAGEPG